MSDDLVFYTNPMSRGRIARWMLEEVGAAYRTELLDFRSGAKPASFLAINPMGKVPAIVHGDVIVTECAAICAYLADAFPQAGLAPAPGDPARGAYYRWMFFAAGPIEAASANKALGVTVSPDKKRMMGYGSMEDLLDGIEHAVTRDDYLAGGRFSAADLYFGSLLGWGLMFGTLERRPAFETYLARLNNRSAAIRAREIDDALLPPEMRAKSPA